MKRSLLILLILLFCFAAVDTTRACEPCLVVLTLEETATQADLIVIGNKVGQDPEYQGDIDGPEWIDVQILETWKGASEDEIIRVNSWDGMCAYGIIYWEGDETLLMFLSEVEDHHNAGVQYDTVEWGCSVPQLVVEDNSVSYEEMSIELNAFAYRLGFDRMIPFTEIEVPTPNPTTKNNQPTLCVPLGLLIFALPMVVLRQNKV